ncbi:hypothetical protein JCM1840_007091 [Sporobolomyces johnsonii]
MSGSNGGYYGHPHYLGGPPPPGSSGLPLLSTQPLPGPPIAAASSTPASLPPHPGGSSYDYAPYPPHLAHHHQHQQQPAYVPRPVSAASIHSPAHQHAPTPMRAGTPRASDPSGSSPAVVQSTSPQLPKARSAMACNLCRKQKMKCEGPEKAPCRRCRAAQVECVFENPPAAPPRPRGGGVSEQWVESRLSQFEQRVATLEETSAMSRTTTAMQPAQQQQQESPLTADHERRIAALETALYALQLSAASQPRMQTVPPQKQQLDYTQHQHGISPTPMSSTQQYGQPAPSYGLHSPAPFIPPGLPGSRYDSPAASLKHEGDGSSNLVGDDQAARHRDKRWRGEAGEPDFIARGVVSEEEATLCFESYFLTFATTSSLNEQRHLTFSETRARSPLFLATVISIGARSLSRFDTFHATLREAHHLAQETMILVDDASELSLLGLKSILLLGLYHAMPQLLLASMFLGHRMGLSTALQEFDELSEEEKQSKKGRALISKGRIFFVSYTWTAFYSFCQCEHGFFDFPIDVLRHQLDILQGSVYAEHPTDFVFRTNLEENLILLNTFKKLGPGMSKDSTRPMEEVYAEVDRAIAALEEWDKTFADMMVVVSQWGDSPDLKAIVPFHHGRQALMRYIFRPGVPLSAYDRDDPKLREYAKMTIESALVILRWGVESRIWMPFSVVGGYVHHVNIPTALSHLFMAARLFPCEADFLTIRPLLHRLLKQCDVTIRGPGATRREIQRAERTKAEVMDFDRFAFEASGEEGLAECKGEMGGGGGALGGKGARANPHGGESNSLFGDEITASLNSLRLELNLWAAPLRSFEDDY